MKQTNKNIALYLIYSVIGIILWIAFLLWIFRGV